MSTEKGIAEMTIMAKEFCKHGTPKQVYEALNSRTLALNVEDEDGNDALMLASRSNPHPKVISILAGAGADVGKKNKDGLNALMLAAMNNRAPSIIYSLIKAGASNYDCDADGKGPFIYAAQYNKNPYVVKAFIDMGAVINDWDRSWKTALMYASQYNANHKVIKALIKAGAKIDISDKSGKTALMYACQYSHNPKAVKVLLKAQSDVNCRDRTGKNALIYAVQYNRSLKVISELLKAGADAAIHDSFGKSALDYAVENKNLTDHFKKGLIKHKSTIAAQLAAAELKTAKSLNKKINELLNKFFGTYVKLVRENSAINAIELQSKYFSTGKSCVDSCLNNGKFKYWTKAGEPMQIEVPSDKYAEALSTMEESIRNGQVPGVKDASSAKNIVKKGDFTYAQAMNIAKTGKIESLTYDESGCVNLKSDAFGMSAAISFAVTLWNGMKFDAAVENACLTGIKVDGSEWAMKVLSGQLSKHGTKHLLNKPAEVLSQTIGPKVTAGVFNSLRVIRNICQNAIMNNATKVLQGNAFSGAATVLALESWDIKDLFSSRISVAQFFKNTVNTAASVSGSLIGWKAGAASGSMIGSLIPFVGTTVGALIGGIAGAVTGGTTASKAAKSATDKFIEDDAKEMLDIVESKFSSLAQDHLLNADEAGYVVDKLQNALTMEHLKDMHACTDRDSYASCLLLPLIENEVSKRKQVKLPTTFQLRCAMKDFLKKTAGKDIQAKFPQMYKLYMSIRGLISEVKSTALKINFPKSDELLAAIKKASKRASK